MSWPILDGKGAPDRLLPFCNQHDNAVIVLCPDLASPHFLILASSIFTTVLDLRSTEPLAAERLLLGQRKALLLTASTFRIPLLMFSAPIETVDVCGLSQLHSVSGKMSTSAKGKVKLDH